MKQMQIDPAKIVDIDFTTPETKQTLKTLQPVVFKEGEAYCCHLGEDHTNGIMGRGNSPDEAINDWEKSLQKRIDEHDENDELAEFVIDSLKISKDDVW
jgi:predicted DNA-binding antitoxin AbrB/MazE fold protein